MWQTKYASAVTKSLGVGVDFRPFSEGDFLSWCLQSVEDMHSPGYVSHTCMYKVYIKLVKIQILLSVFFALIAMGLQRKKSKRYYYEYVQNPFGGTVSKKITKKYMLRNKRMMPCLSIKRVSCLSISFNVRKPLQINSLGFFCAYQQYFWYTTVLTLMLQRPKLEN